MNLAHGYVAQTLQTHDELIAARVNEQRRIVAERRAGRARARRRRPSPGPRPPVQRVAARTSGPPHRRPPHRPLIALRTSGEPHERMPLSVRPSADALAAASTRPSVAHLDSDRPKRGCRRTARRARSGSSLRSWNDPSHHRCVRSSSIWRMPARAPGPGTGAGTESLAASASGGSLGTALLPLLALAGALTAAICVGSLIVQWLRKPEGVTSLAVTDPETAGLLSVGFVSGGASARWLPATVMLLADSGVIAIRDARGVHGRRGGSRPGHPPRLRR